MAKFFINRPIVAMVISILMVIVGIVAMVQLPIAQYPNIAPPEILLTATYPGADALTLEQAVATPIEQQMSGVDNMIYMYSTSQTSGSRMQLHVDFDITTDPSYDQVLTNLRYTQAQSQLPQDVINQGVTVIKSATSPLGLFVLYSPKGTYDALFLSNYAYININDPMTRVPGVGQVQIFGAGQYAVRLWVNPDTLGKLDITVNEIVSALQAQNTVNPAGQVGGEPVPQGQEFTYAVRAQGRLASVEDFENVVVRARPDGSLVRVRDVARVELGAQTYYQQGRLNGSPAAVIAIYQLPGSNAIDAMKAATKLMEEAKARFPQDLDYVTALDTTLAVRAGIEEIVKTLFEALALVLLVVFIFLQGFRTTLIPLLTVPVSLVGTFMVFPLLGFSINTLSLFGLVLAIGLVVDDAIVVVEAVERHIEEGMSPRDAAFKTMEEVSGPVLAIALIMAAVFIPTAFVPGITGRMYQQFAVTIAVSVLISAFNALTLSPALAALLLRPKREMRGPLGWFFRGFNRYFAVVMEGYLHGSNLFIRRAALSMLVLLGVAAVAGVIGYRLPGGFVPEEDQGYLFLNLQLPLAASLQRTAAVNDKIDAILKETPGVKYYTGVAGFSLLSFASTTYNAFYFITLEDWDARDKHGLTADVIMRDLNRRLAGFPDAQAFAFSPPVIPGIGTSGGVTFMLQDRAGRDPAFLAENTEKFLAAARQRPEFALLSTTLLPSVPQLFADVDRDKVLKQGIDLASVYQTLQAFMGGAFVNYFNRFGRVWQVYVQAEGDVPHQGRERRPVLRAELAGECGAALDVGDHEGQLRTGVHRPVQRVPGGADQRHLGPRLQHPAGDAGAGRSVRPDHAAGHGLRLLGDVVPGAGGRPGGAGECDPRLLGAGGVLAHGRPVRELDAAVRRPARHAHRHLRLPRGALAPPLRARRLLADRPAHGDRPRRQERDPHRRVRQGRVRAGHVARRRRARRRPCASARPLYDLVRVHPGLRAVVDRRRCRRGGTPDPRHRRDRRDAGRHAHRQSFHLGELLCQRALLPPATQGRGAAH